MNETTHHRESLDSLAEEFAERYRRGERPTVEEYATAHPDLANEIRDLFPTLAMIEELAPSDSSGEPEAPAGERAIEVRPLDRIGDFRILREIGRGGMGVVYEAEQESLGRRVALKVLPLHAAADPKLLARFRRESRAAGQLHHTNIVPIFEVGEYGDLCWYAMQFIPGQALDEVVKELQRLRAGKAGSTEPVRPSPLTKSLLNDSLARGPELNRTEAYEPAGKEAVCPVTDSAPKPHSNRSGNEVVEIDFRLCCRNVARIGLQAADALAYAHARGVIHRDIKPSNLLLDTAGIVWVSDFGLAKTQDHALTETGDIVGTVRYMAPERFRGECDARSDVYSLGVTLYELLTLKPAFDNTDRLKLIESIGKSDPLKPRSIESQIPRDVETIVLKAIDKDPRRRYQSADEMAGDLRRYLNDEPIHARRVGPAERAWRWVRRNPLVTGLAAAVALVSAIGFALTYSQMQLAREQRDGLRGTLYASQLNLVQSAYEADNVARALGILEQQPKELRGWEWHYWRRQCGGDAGSIRIGDQALTLSLEKAVFSPDGSKLATMNLARRGEGIHAVFGQELLLIDSLTGQLRFSTVASFSQNSSTQIRPAAFSPDGMRVATSHVDKGKDDFLPDFFSKSINRIVVRDTHTGKEDLNVEVSATVFGLAFTTDGKRIVGLVRMHTEVNQVLRIWDSESGVEVGSIKVDMTSIGAPIVSPDGKTVALIQDSPPPDPERLNDQPTRSVIQAIDLTTGRALWSSGNANQWQIVTFSPDGRWLAGCSYDGRVVVVFDATTGQVQQKLLLQSCANETGKETRYDCLAFSPDGSQLVVASMANPTAQVWDVKSARVIRLLRGHKFGIAAIGVDRATSRFLTVSADRTIKCWPTPLRRDWITPPVSFQCVSPDGRAVAFRAGNSNKLAALSVAMLDPERQPQRLGLPSDSKPDLFGNRELDSPVFSADGKRLIVAVDEPETQHSALWTFDVGTGQVTRAISLGTNVGQVNLAVRALSISFLRHGSRWCKVGAFP